MENNSLFKKVSDIFNKQRRDYVFKTVLSSSFSFVTTVIFALYNGFLGIYMSSVWHGSICVYYLFFVFIRGIILFSEQKSKNDNKKTDIRYKGFVISTAMLFLLNLALICPVALMVKFEKPVNVGLFYAIVSAAYTTYKIVMACIHIRKQKNEKHNNILVTELRTINFIDSLVSVLSLQNTLIMVKSSESGTGRMFTLSAVSSAIIFALIMLVTIRLQITGIKQNRIQNKNGAD